MAIRDLRPLRLLIQSRMVDSCTITRDAAGADDDTLDQGTGALTPPAGDATTIYSGPCMIYPTARRESELTEGSRSTTEDMFMLRIPWDATEPEIGDVAVVDAALHDPSLVGRELRVKAIDRASLLTSRDLVVEDRWSA